MSNNADKTELLDHFNGLIVALGDDLSLTDAGWFAQIEKAAQRLGTPTKVVIAGLESSGHHELAEFFLGTQLFASRAEAVACPAIDVRYGDALMTRLSFGSKRLSSEDCAIDAAIAHAKPDGIVIELPNPIVSEIEFRILPAYDGAVDRTRYLVDLLSDTEVLIWCTDAASAWQPAEQHLWLTVPDDLKRRSLLALTGANQVASGDAKLAQDEKRALLRKEFRSLTAISIDAAKSAAPGGNVVDRSAFVSSGGQGLLSALMTVVQSVQGKTLEAARQLRVELGKSPIGQTEPSSPRLKSLTAGGSIEAANPIDAVQAFLLESAGKCNAALKARESDSFDTVFEEMIALLSGLSDFVRGGLTLASEHDLIVAQLEEAEDLVGLLSYEGDLKATQEAADIVRQISTDIWRQIQPTAAHSDTQRSQEPNLELAAG